MTITPLQSSIHRALRSFLTSILPPAVEIVLGHDNRVPEPVGDDFIVFTPLLKTRLATNAIVYDDATAYHHFSSAHSFQLDIHGPTSGDNAQLIAGLFRSDYAGDQIASPEITPLDCGDPKQISFENAESQTENRWSLTVTFQVDQTISVPIETTDSIIITPQEIN